MPRGGARHLHGLEVATPRAIYSHAKKPSPVADAVDVLMDYGGLQLAKKSVRPERLDGNAPQLGVSE